MPEYTHIASTDEGETTYEIDFKITCAGSGPSYGHPGDPVEIEIQDVTVTHDRTPDIHENYVNKLQREGDKSIVELEESIYELLTQAVLDNFGFQDYYEWEAADYAEYLRDQRDDKY